MYVIMFHTDSSESDHNTCVSDELETAGLTAICNGDFSNKYKRVIIGNHENRGDLSTLIQLWYTLKICVGARLETNTEKVRSSWANVRLSLFDISSNTVGRQLLCVSQPFI